MTENTSAWTGLEVAWLAGLLEGEGSFHCSPDARAIAVYLRMTDADVVNRVALLTGCRLFAYPGYNGGSKTMYAVNVRGAEAVAVMRAIRPLMGTRRGAAIDEALARYGTGARRAPVGRGKRRAQAIAPRPDPALLLLQLVND